MPVRVVFFGNSSSDFSARHFQALLDVPCTLCGVVDVPASKRDTTNPLPADLPDFTKLAQELDIPILSPEKTDGKDFLEYVSRLDPDLFLTVGYAVILMEAALKVPRLLAANFHASLLPEYRGKHPVFWTLRAGELWAGLTVHAMDTGIDTGDILYQVKVRTRRDDSVATLYERIMDRSTPLVRELIADLEQGKVPRQPQTVGGGSYFSSTCDEDFRIDWSWDAERIRRMVMITPGKCFIQREFHRLYFQDAEIYRTEESAPAGTILKVGRRRVAIAAGEGAVSFAELQKDSNSVMPASQLFEELGLKTGDALK